MLENFERMHGGEIFVPKLPSVQIADLAKAYAPNLKTNIVGIRPGEKLHEVMCPADDSHLTVEFKDHYVIAPSIKFHSKEVDYMVNAVGEAGHRVPRGFEYNSGNNSEFLTIDGIRSLDDVVA